MDKYNFYYDESEHDRRISQATFKTFRNDEFQGNFIASISGWRSNDEFKIKESYIEFENKYKDRKNKNGEIKSNSIKLGDSGFASLSKHNIPFIKDFLSTISNNDIHFYFSVINKVEFLINQMLKHDYTDSIYNAEAMKYIIVKAIVTYQPDSVINSIFNEPNKFVDNLKQFFDQQIKKDKANIKLKNKEISAYEQVMLFLKTVCSVSTFNWDYNIAFEGFLLILQQQNIDNYSIGIDKEMNTLSAAMDLGLKDPYELNSEDHFGIRISDMISGLIGKFIKSLHRALNDSNSIANVKKNLIGNSWFDINEDQLELYRLLHDVIIKRDSSWSKFYAGMYADDVILFTTFLEQITSYKTADEIKLDIKNIPEEFNTQLLLNLRQHFSNNFGSQF